MPEASPRPTQPATQGANPGMPAVSGELQMLLEYSLDILTVLDADGTWRYSSPAGTQLLGHPAGFTPDGGIFSLLHPDDLGTAVHAFGQLLAGTWDSTNAVELRVQAADGTYRILETYGRNLCDDPEVRGIVLNSRDITERRDAEAALRRDDRWFRSLVAHASEYTLVFDAEFKLAYASPSVVEVTAGTLARDHEVIQEDMVHPDDFSVIEAGFGELLAAPLGTTRRLEFRLKLGGAAGTFRWVDAIVTNLLDDPDVAGVVVNAQDVTERHEHEDRLDHLATHDALTGLPNRFAFERELAKRLRAREETDEPLAICFIDLDHFKRVNDSLGHRAGDELLRIMARRIDNVVRDEDFVARLGGDEFVVLAENTDLDEAEVLGHRLLYAMNQDVFLGSTRIHVDASVGVNVTDLDTPSDPVEFMRDVDVAMYEAKNRGRAQIVRFDVALREAAQSRLDLETAVRRAVASDELVVHYQPLVGSGAGGEPAGGGADGGGPDGGGPIGRGAAGGAVVGLEALVRWQHPTRGLLPPSAFLAVAAQCGLSSRVEEHVLGRVLADLRDDPDLPRVWVNLSALELSRPRHARRITTAAIEADVSLTRLGFEVTETVLAADTDTVRENLAWLRDRGARVALDDYGTGYASLANLRELPIDELKIDQSIISGMVDQPFDRTVVEAIVRIAASLGLGVVAEGVETTEQAELARELGIATLQGYLFARPGALGSAPAVAETPVPS